MIPSRLARPPEHAFLRHVVAAALVAVLASGCAAFEKREPMTLAQVVQLSKEGVLPDDIINRLRESQTVFALSGSGYAKLREQGVDDAVLDYIQKSYVARVEMDTRLRYPGWYGPGYYPYPYRPWPYWYGW